MAFFGSSKDFEDTSISDFQELCAQGSRIGALEKEVARLQADLVAEREKVAKQKSLMKVTVGFLWEYRKMACGQERDAAGNLIVKLNTMLDRDSQAGRR